MFSYIGLSILEVLRKQENKERGNVLFLILIVVALFAALSYAVTTSSRGGGSADTEKAELDQAVSDNCVSNVQAAELKVSLLNGCDSSEISYELDDGTNPNALAPVDGSCHVFRDNGGGAYACGGYLVASGCDLTALASVGDSCGGAIYMGDAFGGRLYGADTNQSDSNWADAVASCQSLGADWYLPGALEMFALQASRTGLSLPIATYWSAQDAVTPSNALVTVIDANPVSFFSSSKTSTLSVRCVRRD